MGFVYLASPYTHPDQLVMERRFKEAEHAMVYLLLGGVTVHAPIVMCHVAASLYNLPKESSWWRFHNYNMISRCDSMLVLVTEGVEESEGVKEEINYCIKHSIPVRYLRRSGEEYVETSIMG